MGRLRDWCVRPNRIDIRVARLLTVAHYPPIKWTVNHLRRAKKGPALLSQEGPAIRPHAMYNSDSVLACKTVRLY